MRVLVVEDERELSSFVADLLSRNGMLIDCVASLEDASAALSTTAFDLVVLDRGLADGDGLDLIGRCPPPKPPILVLTARDATADIVEGLNKGASDYLTKPFEPDELLARVRALFRRPIDHEAPTIRLGGLELVIGSGCVQLDGAPFLLPRREYLILEALAKRNGRVLSRAALEDAVYGFDDAVESNTLDAQVSRLRRRLREGGAAMNIHAIRGVGYMLKRELT